MAGAEIRAVWQRTANRCFVQEDAKRAPKLACCQPPSSGSIHVKEGQTGVAGLPDHPSVAFMPTNGNPSYKNLPSDTRWWLQLQPSFGHLKEFTAEQLGALETEVENLIYREGLDVTSGDGDKSCDFTAKRVKEDPDMKWQNMKAFYCKNLEKNIQFDSRENAKQLQIDSSENLKFKECCFNPEAPWIENEKNVPWWRVTDKDDLASLVAQKSLDHIENCDLPPPQKMNVKSYSCVQLNSSSRGDIIPLSMNRKAQQGCLHSPTIYSQGYHISESTFLGDIASSGGHLENVSGDSSRGYGEVEQVSENDPCKVELLEAVRRSQTRAREAEKAAKQACDEKDDIVKLLFRQASQLFAYKQWFQLLQLETLYYQMKNVEQPMSTLFPVVLPWMPQKGRKLQNEWQKHPKGKQPHVAHPGHDISEYAVAFTLGLSLVGAGLFLGWTIGWMLPL